MLKRLTNGDTHLRGLAPEQLSYAETWLRFRAVSDTVSALTGPAIELKISLADGAVCNHCACSLVSDLDILQISF